MKQKLTPQEKSYRLGNYPILKLLFTMSIPIMFSMLIQALYNIVDSIFVGMVSIHAQEALSHALSLQNLFIAFALGIGIGSASLLSRRLGEKNENEASELAKHGIWLASIMSLFFLVFGFPITYGYMKALIPKSQTITFNNAVTYTSIATITAFFPIFQIVLSRILQATGNVKIPMYAQLTGALINILLDPLFILLFKWGILGASISTLIAQIVAFLFIVYIIKYKNVCHIKIFEFKLKPKKLYLKQIIKQGLPITIVSAIVSITITYINYLFKLHNVVHADTILGIYFKLQSFVFMPIFGLNQGALPIIAYNIGANNKKRVIKTFLTSIIVAFILTIISLLIAQLFSKELINLFISKNSQGFDNDIILMGSNALRIISWSFVPASTMIICGTLFQALSKSYISSISIFLRQLVVLCLVATIALNTNWGINGVWSAFWISEISCYFIFLPISFILINKSFK